MFCKAKLAAVVGYSALLAGAIAARADTAVDFLQINQSAQTFTNVLFNNGAQSANQDWSMSNNFSGGSTFQVNDISSGTSPFTLTPGAPDNALFMNGNGQVGLGTSTPGGNFAARLHLFDPSPEIVLDNGAQRWSIFANVAGAGFFNETSGRLPFNVNVAAPSWSMFIDDDGTVGIGTLPSSDPDPNIDPLPKKDPEAKLHVIGQTDTRLTVENSDGANDNRQYMFQLKNAGPGKVRFAITNNTNNTWTFDNNLWNDWFSISKVGTLVDEFVIKSNGDGEFRGRSFAVNHINTSSRSVKTDFSEIDTGDILQRLVSLPISKWRYRIEDQSQRHIGPVAEDFQEVFEMGDGKTISTVDASGIAFAAIQGLVQEIADKESQIQTLKDQLRQQELRIKSQDERMTEIELTLAEFLRAGAQRMELGAIN